VGQKKTARGSVVILVSSAKTQHQRKKRTNMRLGGGNRPKKRRIKSKVSEKSGGVGNPTTANQRPKEKRRGIIVSNRL